MEKNLTSKIFYNERYNLRSIVQIVTTILLLFLAAEFFIRIMFDPCKTSHALFDKYEPKPFNYGLKKEVSSFHSCGDETRYISNDPYFSSSYRYKQQKPKNEVRIFSIGTSVSRYPRNWNLTFFLKEYLSELRPSKDFLIIDTSSPGHGTLAMKILLEQIIESHQQPDLIIVNPVGINEKYDLVYSEQVNNRSLFDEYLERSKLLMLLRRYDFHKINDRFVNAPEKVEISLGGSDDNAPAWLNNFGNNLKQICNIAEEADIPLIMFKSVGNFAHKGGVDVTNRSFPSQVSRINAVLEEATSKCNSMHLVDPEKVFANTPPFRKDPTKKVMPYFTDYAHWSARAHKATALEVSKVIQAEYPELLY